MPVYRQGDGVCVLGGTGFIGRHLIDYMLANKIGPIRVLTRKPSLIQGNGDVTLIKGDLLCVNSVNNLLVDQSLVINLAYIKDDCEANLCAVDYLVAACLENGVSRLIHCSTAVVAGRVDTPVINETTVCHPYTEYERTKLAIEERLLERSAEQVELIIVRPTAVFGAGGANLAKIAKSSLNHPRMVNILTTMVNAHRRMHFVPVEDVVGAIVFLATLNRDLSGERFIISRDDHPQNNYYDLATYFAQRFGFRSYPEIFFPFHYVLVNLLLRIIGRSQIKPQQVFRSEKLYDYGFSEATDFMGAMDRFYANYLRENPQ